VSLNVYLFYLLLLLFVALKYVAGQLSWPYCLGLNLHAYIQMMVAICELRVGVSVCVRESTFVFGVYTLLFRRYGKAYVQCFAKLLYVAFYSPAANCWLPVARCLLLHFAIAKAQAHTHILTHAVTYTLTHSPHLHNR